MKLWKPNGEDWKPKQRVGLHVLDQLTEDLKAERNSSGRVAAMSAHGVSDTEGKGGSTSGE